MPASRCALRLPSRESSRPAQATPPAPRRADRQARGGRPAGRRGRAGSADADGLVTGSREKRRRVPLASIPARMQQAVLAIEDRRFYGHPGIDPISVVGAVVTNLTSTRRQPVGRSTVTQQLSRMFFLSEEFNAELQSGQRLVSPQGARSLHGGHSRDQSDQGRDPRAVSERRLPRQPRVVCAARRRRSGAHLLRQGRQQPLALRSRADRRASFRIRISTRRSSIASARRNDAISCCRRWPRPSSSPRDAAERASNDPITVVARAVDNEAPYFVDYLGEELQAEFPGITQRTGALDIFTTLDLNLQRYAQEAVRDGLAKVDQITRASASASRVPHRRRSSRSIRELARSSRWSAGGSTTSRSSTARRPPGVNPDPRSSRSCIWPPSSAPPTRAAPISRRPRWCGTSRRRGPTISRSGRRATTTASTTASSRCVARSRCRETSRPSRWPNKPVSIRWRRCGRRRKSGVRRSRVIRRSLSACSS